jgi:hypothetical protein
MSTNTPDTNALDKFNVIKFAKDMLAEVDQIRAYDLIPDDQTKEGLKIPSESRLNAFFRLVGLPMFVTIEDENKKDGSEKAGNEDSTGTRVLSPGFFGGKFSGKRIKNSEIEIDVEGQSQKINFILNTRESLLSRTENSIGTEEKNDDMTSAFNNALPLVANLSDKNNNVYSSAEVGSEEFKRVAFKKLLPPVTCYKTILPVRNEIARPFTLEENERKVDSQTILKLPFIETVIRIRLLSAANAGSSEDQSRASDFQSSVEAITDSENIESFNNLKANLLEEFILNKLLAAFYQLAVKWIEIKKKQEVLRKSVDFKVSIKTSSSKASPFGKRIEADLDSDSNVARKLKDLKTKLAKEEILLSLLPSDDSLLKTNAKTSNTKNTTFAALTNQFTKLINFNAEQLRKAIKKEEEFVKKQVIAIEKLRVEIETITGEFTGLSVPDVLAVIAGLFTMDIDFLVGLLDAEAVDNMKKDKRLRSALESLEINEPELDKTIGAVEDLTEKINNWYAVLKAVISVSEDRLKRGRQQKNRTKKKRTNRKSSGALKGA